MARALRLDFDGATHHVTSRGNERRPIFHDDIDRRMFLLFLGRAVQRFGWSLTAWVLMTNHYHLVICTRGATLSRGMQWLNTSYAGWFNHRHQRAGHLFQGRFKSILVERELYFRRLLRYVVLNPVRAAMVVRPEDYEWSSFRQTAGLDAADEWLDVTSALEVFYPDPEAARAAYADFVISGTTLADPIWDSTIGSIYLGSEAWAKETRRRIESAPRSTDHPRSQRSVGRPTMPAIVAAVASVANENAHYLRTSHGGSLRRLIAWLGWHEGLVTLRSIAAALRITSEGHVSRMIRRCEAEFARSGLLLAQLDGALHELRT